MPILRDMVRIGERRPPALPSTSDQQVRRAAILTAATRLGRIRALDRIHAREIAAEAGVALRTLYRYYPSKYHVYAAVLQSQVAELGASARSGTGDDPVAAVAALMAGACRNMLRHEHLAHAMITSTQTVRAQTGAIGDYTVRDLIVRTAGVTDPTADQLRIARLIEQVTFGVLTWTVGGEVDAVDAVDDVRRACESLIGDAFG
ncbi:MAG: TetR/AcrR family transcriptional regulator, cholesterol catabolism regulator [Mycobacterium sp.]|nr:TetR/AcrR family transcriptional regulator, cholesterol catabolism regulator [Mycobacterium sp.]